MFLLAKDITRFILENKSLNEERIPEIEKKSIQKKLVSWELQPT